MAVAKPCRRRCIAPRAPAAAAPPGGLESRRLEEGRPLLAELSTQPPDVASAVRASLTCTDARFNGGLMLRPRLEEAQLGSGPAALPRASATASGTSREGPGRHSQLHALAVTGAKDGNYRRGTESSMAIPPSSPAVLEVQACREGGRCRKSGPPSVTAPHHSRTRTCPVRASLALTHCQMWTPAHPGRSDRVLGRHSYLASLHCPSPCAPASPPGQSSTHARVAALVAVEVNRRVALVALRLLVLGAERLQAYPGLDVRPVGTAPLTRQRCLNDTSTLLTTSPLWRERAGIVRGTALAKSRESLPPESPCPRKDVPGAAGWVAAAPLCWRFSPVSC